MQNSTVSAGGEIVYWYSDWPCLHCSTRKGTMASILQIGIYQNTKYAFRMIFADPVTYIYLWYLIIMYYYVHEMT